VAYPSTEAWRRLGARRKPASVGTPIAVASLAALDRVAGVGRRHRGIGLYYLPPFLEGLSAFGLVLRRPQVWADYVAPMLLGPPFLVSAGWLVTVFLVLVIATVAGAVRGVWKSFFR
jgi:hypothetical protein